MTGKVRFRSDLIQFENIESMSYRVGENFTEMSIYLALASKVSKQRRIQAKLTEVLSSTNTVSKVFLSPLL